MMAGLQMPITMLLNLHGKSILQYRMNGTIGLSGRALRMYLGVIIAGFGIFYNSIWAAIGIPVFLTGVIGMCPLYKLPGVKAFGQADAEH